LEVERVRFGQRLQVEMDVEEACEDCRVPPLVLQPLIENAIKHGIATLVDGGTIRLEARIEDDGNTLAVTVENEFDPDAPAPRRNGLGLRNVRGRLETRFDTKAAFRAAPVSHGHGPRLFRAEMAMPCDRAESAPVGHVSGRILKSPQPAKETR